MGKSLAREFAKRQFNLILVDDAAYTEQLRKISKEFSTGQRTYYANSGGCVDEGIDPVLTKCIVVNFEQAFTQQDWVDKVMEQLDVGDSGTMSISVLVNATAAQELPSSCNNAMLLNTVPAIVFTEKLTPRFLERYQKLKLKGAILTVTTAEASTIAAWYPGYVLHKATNAFVNTFMNFANIENHPAIDYLTIHPLGVVSSSSPSSPPSSLLSTDMSDNHKLLISTDQCAAACMRQLSLSIRPIQTNGWWFHCFMDAVLTTIPTSILYRCWPVVGRRIFGAEPSQQIQPPTLNHKKE
jgi:short-subunit dehydrogenase